jgi:CBS domain-containing protein
MSRSEPQANANRQIIDRLKAARDTARLHAHLLSLDARQRLREADDKLAALENQAARGADTLVEGVAAKATEIGQAITDLLRDAGTSFLLAAPVSEIMRREPATCGPGESLNQAARLMWEHDCGAIPVVDQEHRLVGIVTDRDICMAVYTRGQPLWAVSVISTMSHAPVFAGPNDSIGAVVRLMSERRVRRIPIVADDRLIGMVALADIARHVRRNASHSLPAALTLAHALADISDEPLRRAAE